jgi:sugar-specific transcriptional regulator TrmB
MKLDAIFSSIGLDAEHARLYAALVTKSPVTLAELARAARLYRPAAYRLLPELEEKGLVERVLRGKRAYFAPRSPAALAALVEDSRHASAETLRDLQAQFEKHAKAPQVTVGYGRRGIANVYDDIVETLRRGDVFYRYSSARKKRPRDAYVPVRYEERRDAKRLERYVITNNRTSSQKRKKLERYIRIIPPEFDRFEYDVTLLVYKNKIAYVDYGSETALTIENAAVAEFQLKLFKVLFSQL